MYTREPEPNVWYTFKLGEESEQEESEEEESEEEEEEEQLDESMDSGTSNEWGAF